MTENSVLAVSFIMNVVAVLFIMCAVVLILIILIQKGKGGGLSGALGGGMASGILGSKTGDFLTWVTIVLAGLFLLLAVVLSKFYRPVVTDFGARQAVEQKQPASEEQPVSVKQPISGEQPASAEPPAPSSAPVEADKSADANLPKG